MKLKKSSILNQEIRPKLKKNNFLLRILKTYLSASILLFVLAFNLNLRGQNTSDIQFCTKCKGLGFFSNFNWCEHCNGTSIEKKHDQCPKCNGNKILSCPKSKIILEKVNYVCDECNGYGYIYYSCSYCNGRGYVPQGWYDIYGYYHINYVTCAGCYGAKTCKFKCDDCSGKGKWTETEQSEITCSKCGGEGFVDCYYCGGDGTFESSSPCIYCIKGKIEERVKCEHLVKPLIDWDYPIEKSISSNESTFKIKVCIHSSPQLQSIKVVQNGEANDISVSNKGGNVVQTCSNYVERDLQLTSGINTIKITATNEFGESISESKTIYYHKPEETINESHNKYYALIIGVDEYSYPISNLTNPVKDALNLSKTLSDYYSFNESNITVLKNPTRDNIISAFDNLISILDSSDNLLIFYTGHGKLQGVDLGYWLPKDAQPDKSSTWISNDEIVGKIRSIKSKHVLTIIDACFSGSLLLVSKNANDNNCNALNKLPSRTAFTSGNLQLVPDNSVFINEIINQLKENTYSCISAETLANIVIEYIRVNSQYNQMPLYGFLPGGGLNKGGDFIFQKK